MADDDPTRPDSSTVMDRTHGVEFGSLEEELAAHEYPTTADDLAEAYGDRQVRLTGGSQPLDEVLGVLDSAGTHYESPQEVQQAICRTIGCEALGREGYSDRGGVAPDEDPVSF